MCVYKYIYINIVLLKFNDNNSQLSLKYTIEAHDNVLKIEYAF